MKVGEYVGELKLGPLRKLNAELRPLGMKVCSSKRGCWRVLRVGDFRKGTVGPGKLQSYCRECERAWSAAQHRENSEYRRNWHKENSEEQYFKNRRYRAKKKCEQYGGTAYPFTLEELRQSWRDRSIDIDSCYLCGIRFWDGEGRTEEHDIPLARGGDDSVDNLYPAHHSCNARKKDKTNAEYRVWLLEQSEPWCMVKAGKLAMENGRRRARKYNRPVDMFSYDELVEHWLDIDVDPLRCVICQRPRECIDHIIELEKDDSPGHVMLNLQPLCHYHNNQKKPFPTMEAWFAHLVKIGQWMPVDAIRARDWDAPLRNAAAELERMAKIAAGRVKNKTHCSRNHLLEGNNLVPSQLKRNMRSCRSCHNAHSWFRDRSITPTADEFQAKSDEYYAKFMPEKHVWSGEALPQEEMALF